MKRRETIRQELGITQKEMAALLNVNRSQWAMYEIGERMLPTSAMLLLAEMALFLQSLEVQRKVTPRIASEKNQQLLAKLFLENQYQNEKISREINDVEKKQQAHNKALQLIAHLQSDSQGKTPTLSTILERIAIRAKKGLARHDNSRLTTLYFQQELLIREQAFLKEAMKME